MIAELKNVLRGFLILRHSDVIADLCERRLHLQQVRQLRQCGQECQVSNEVVLNAFSQERMKMGESITLSHGTLLSYGDALNGFGTMAIGDRTWCGPYNNLRAGGGAIKIGNDCLISQYCTLVARNHGIELGVPIRTQKPAEDRRDITLGNDVWLGAGVSIMPGVTVSDGAVIGAGSVVTKNIGTNEIWAGVPARRIGQR